MSPPISNPSLACAFSLWRLSFLPHTITATEIKKIADTPDATDIPMTADELRLGDGVCAVVEGEEAADVLTKEVVRLGMADVENVVTGGIVWVLLTNVLVTAVWDVHVKGLVVEGGSVVDGWVTVECVEAMKGMEVDAMSGTFVAVMVACVSRSAPFTSSHML